MLNSTIYNRRRVARIRQRELAQRLGIWPSTLTEIEHGRVTVDRAMREKITQAIEALSGSITSRSNSNEEA